MSPAGWSVWISCCGAVLLATAGAAGQPPNQAEVAATNDPEPSAAVAAEYREVVARAIAEFDLGHMAEARALFLRAHELWPSARTLRTLGMTAFELRMYPRALAELQAALDDPRRPLPEEQRAQVAALVEQARGFVGRYQLQVTPADAELLVDGVRRDLAQPLVMGVGTHQLIARAPSYQELRRELVVQGREDEPLVLRLGSSVAEAVQPAQVAKLAPVSARSSAPPSDRPDRLPAIVAFGVGGAGVVVGAVAGIIAFGKKHDVEHLEAGHRAADISTAAFITAGVGAALGTLLWLLAPGSGAPDHPPDAAARSFVIATKL